MQIHRYVEGSPPRPPTRHLPRCAWVRFPELWRELAGPVARRSREAGVGSQDPRDQRSVRRPNGCGRELWNRSWASPRWRVHTTFQKQAVWGGQHGQGDEEALFSRSPGGRAPPEHPIPQGGLPGPGHPLSPEDPPGTCTRHRPVKTSRGNESVFRLLAVLPVLGTLGAGRTGVATLSR